MNYKDINKEQLELRLQLLKSNILFSETDEATLKRLAALFTEIEYESGNAIIRKNDPSTSIYIILKGTVRIHDGGYVFNLLEEGNIFGEYSLLDTKPRSASVTTVTQCRFLKLDNDSLRKDKDTHDAVVHGIVKVLTRRLRDYNELEEKLTNAYTKIRLQNLQMEQEKKKIERQNEQMKILNNEILERNEEITNQRDQLAREKKVIEKQNAEILQKNEEIIAQKEEIEVQRDQLAAEKKVIEEQNAEILLKNEEIRAQNEEIRAQRDELEQQRNQLLKKQREHEVLPKKKSGKQK
ncbi:MAG: cyclic nucleotide-binding domain-containing protein [Bacteroidetes bacterium]|nr:cyclic nucleotide-binding domain-containing protein [Bacteroidota bacterium]